MEAVYSQLGSGLIVPAHVVKRRSDRPLAFDFFAGCGGFSLGFIKAGFQVVGAVEWDAMAALTYMVNLGSHPITIHYTDEDGKNKLNKVCERHIFSKDGKKPKSVEDYRQWDTSKGIYNDAVGSGLSGSGWIRHEPDAEPVRDFWFGDVRKLKGDDILHALGIRRGDLDVVFGGPPCQGFSRAGRQQIADLRNNLVYEYARMILELQPKTFVMEEVPDIINFMDPDGVPVLDKFCRILHDGGFGRYDLLKKSLEMQAGAVFGMKGNSGNDKTGKKRRKDESVQEEVQDEQMTLF